MNLIKTPLALVLAMFLMGTTSCQNDKYPDLGDGLYAEIVTSKGTMVLKLTPEKTPVTVANFVALVEGTHPMVGDDFKNKPFYNGLNFHRVMNDFMIQGGCPNGDGSGNPGYKFGDEFDETLKHDKPGILSMANSGPNSNGSQFFITEKPTPWLDNKHSVFGEIVLGLEIQDSISNVKVMQGNRPADEVTIEAVNIVRQGFDARKFDAVDVWEKELPLLEEKRKKKEEEARLKQEEEQRLIKDKSEKAKAEFIKNNAELKGRVENLPVGITMIFTKEGDGRKPTSAQKALIDYAGYFENGDLFDTSWSDIAKKHGKYNEARDQRGGYAPFPMIYNETARLVPGFRAAMLNMKVGDKARVFIPSYLGYGPAGWGNGLIPPNTNLIFDLELVGIEGEQ